MSSARVEVLKLVAEGKITPEEAERILSGLDEQSTPPPPEGGRRLGDTLSQVLEQVGETVRSAMDDAVGAAQRVFEEHRPGTEGINISSGGFDLPEGSRLKVQQALRVSFGGTSRGGHVILRCISEGRTRILRGEAVEVHRSGSDYVLTWAKGNLELEIPRRLAALEARCMGGDIEVHEFLGPMSIETMGGEVRILGARASLRARSIGGRVRLTDLDLREGYSSISTTGGDVLVDLTKESSVTIHAGTLGGAIILPPGSDRESGIAHRRGTAVVGEGKAELKIDTLGGDVNVRLV